MNQALGKSARFAFLIRQTESSVLMKTISQDGGALSAVRIGG
jgi:hypothetical protein